MIMVKKIQLSEYRTKINKEELSLKKEQSLPTNKDKGEDDLLKEEYEIEDSKKKRQVQEMFKKADNL